MQSKNRLFGGSHLHTGSSDCGAPGGTLLRLHVLLSQSRLGTTQSFRALRIRATAKDKSLLRSFHLLFVLHPLPPLLQTLHQQQRHQHPDRQNWAGDCRSWSLLDFIEADSFNNLEEDAQILQGFR